MEIIGAAALIAVGIVVAAVFYRRPHDVSAAAAERETATAAALRAALSERSGALELREQALARQDADLQRGQSKLDEGRLEIERTLERLAGMSGAKAKQLMLKEIEDQVKHDAARRIRQIEEQTKREAERRVRNILSVCMQRLAARHAARRPCRWCSCRRTT